MKAHIRNKGETVTEDMNLTFINWNNGSPLTRSDWYGGSYILVNDYDPNDEPSPVMIPQSEPETEVIENEDDYVVIDGKRYSKAELRSLIE